MRLTSSGLTGEGTSMGHRLLGFLDAVLRGVGQVMLQDNAWTGLVFLVGIFYNSAVFGWAALVGTVASTAAALLLGVDRAKVRAGLFGFNGALVAIALLYFLRPDALAWAYVVLAAACSTVLMAALLHLLGTWRIPALTAPFVLTTLCFILAGARFGRLQTTSLLPTAGLPTSATVEGVVTGTTVIHGVFMGVAQVFFQANVITGVLFVIALLINSRTVFLEALIGSLLGLLVAWALGAAEPAIRGGAFGFNSVLTAIALGGGYFVRNRASLGYALIGVIATAVVFAALSAALQPIGMPALTAPFVIVVWAFLFGRPVFTRLRGSGAVG